MLFKGSVDGYKSKEFHKKCDKQGPTLSIIRSKQFNLLFGGFTTQSWDSTINGNYPDKDAFVFSLTKKQKLNIKPHYAKNGIYCD